MENKGLKEDIDELKESTLKLGTQLEEVTREQMSYTKRNLSRFPQQIVSRLNQNMDQLREKVTELADDATEKSKAVDKTVHNKPYWFLAGALGVGMLLGRHLTKRKQQ